MSYTGTTPNFTSVKAGDVTISGNIVYFGDPDTDGTFRVIQGLDVLTTQVRVLGVYEDRDIINL